MNSFLLYVLKSTLSIGLLYLAFRTIMRKETFFALNRMALITLVVLSFIIPLLYLPSTIKPIIQERIIPQVSFYTSEAEPTTAVEMGKTTVSVPSPVTVKKEKTFHYSANQTILITYLLGVLFSFLVFIHGIVSVLLMLRKAQRVKMEGFLLFILEKDIPAFSFCKMVFISRSDYSKYGTTILAHEQQHIRLGHFYDLMLMEIVKMAHWFNPVIYWLIQDLKAIHEFQADQYTLSKGIDAKKYQLLIIEKGVGPQRLSLANSFNHCQIKKRITMMNKSKTSKAGIWKVATFLPLLALLLMAFGRTSENLPPERKLLLQLVSATPEDSVKQWSEKDFKELNGSDLQALFKKESEGFSIPLNVYIIHIDENSKITIDGKAYTMDELQSLIHRESMSFKETDIKGQTKRSPKSIIIIHKDSSTLQADYLQMLNMVANTILKVRGNLSKEVYGSSYQKLLPNQRNEMDKLIPMNVFYSKTLPLKVPDTSLQKSSVKFIPPPPNKDKHTIKLNMDGSINYNLDTAKVSISELTDKIKIELQKNPKLQYNILIEEGKIDDRLNKTKDILKANGNPKVSYFSFHVDKGTDGKTNWSKMYSKPMDIK